MWRGIMIVYTVHNICTGQVLLEVDLEMTEVTSELYLYIWIAFVRFPEKILLKKQSRMQAVLKLHMWKRCT